jgi:1,4-dihydroxy-6-naphthoate synthase
VTRQVLRLGFSPCPNDTFMFHALVEGLVTVPGVAFEPFLADIEELNRRALGEDPLEVQKLSLGALSRAAERFSVLPAGAALGRGVGPLVVVPEDSPLEPGLRSLAGRRVAIPGLRTTANLLLRLFGPPGIEPVEMRFDRILAAVGSGAVDAGLIIHESRFTYGGHRLRALADLGEVWEAETGLPLPLGVIAARRGLPGRLVDAVGSAVRASVQCAFADPAASRSYVRAHSQEISDAVCDRHIALYVNEFSVDLGVEGRAAIDELLARGRELHLLDGSASPWRDG